jgi:sulfate adenylyltransferase
LTGVAEHGLVAPHGGRLTTRTAERPDGVDGLERIPLSPRELADLDMIASGALSPLEGFMGRDDYLRVLGEMRLADGLPWALPVCLAVERAPRGHRVALTDSAGTPMAVLDVEDVYEYDRRHEAGSCFGTTEAQHPGVRRVLRQHPLYLAGRVTVFRRAPSAFPEIALDPADTRRLFADREWRRVAGFQTRNAPHRGHEYLVKSALEIGDGLLLHPLVGETKSDDVPAETRVRSYQLFVERYFPRDRVLLAAFPAAMRYAGPREAIWHAITRKNYGCSHFIVGRDHAGVGGYYGPYDAQHAFRAFAPHELGIEPLFFENSFYCLECHQMATSKTCPHDRDRHVSLSGTKMRDMLSRGELPPLEVSRPEVAELVMDAYRRPPVRVCVAEDPRTKNGLARALRARPGLSVVGEYCDGRSALEDIIRLEPDVALLEVDTPGLDAVAVTTAVERRALRTRVVLMTASGSDEARLPEMRAGVYAYVDKDAGAERILDTVAAVARGERAAPGNPTERAAA